MRLLSVTLRNIRTFKDKEFDLSERGLVSITGTNGAGKTTIFNAIRANIYNAMNDKSKFNDLVRNKKDAQILVKFENGGHVYTSDLSRIKNKWVYTILQDEVDVTKHSQIDARKQPAEFFGLSSDEWDASVHLSQKGSHILVSGKPSQRKDYIAEFYGIDDKYDVVQDKAKIELARVESEIKEIESFSNTKTTLQEELGHINLEDSKDLEKELEELEKELELAKLQLETNKEKLEEIINWENHSPDAYPAGFEEVDADESLKYYNLEKSNFDNAISNYNRAIEYNSKIEKSNASYKAMEKYIESKSILEQQYPEEYGFYIKEKDELTKKKSESSNIARINIKLKELGDLPDSPSETIDTQPLKLELDKLNKESSIKTAKYNAIMNGDCPTCGSKFEHEHIMGDYEEIVSINEKIASKQKEILDIENKNTQILEERNKIKIRDEYLEQLKTMPEFSANENLRLDELIANIPDLIDYQGKKNTFSHMELSEPMEVTPVPTQTEIDQNKVNVDFFSKMVRARMICPKQKPIEGTSEEFEEMYCFKIGSKIDDINNKKYGIKAKISNISDKKAAHDRIKKQIDVIDKKFAKLGSLHEEELYWKTMVFAYGPKGLRVIQLQKIMDLVISVLPAYTSRMFNGKSFSFRTEVSSGSIGILATREDNEGKYEYDISTLSGGEAARMALCLTFAVAKSRLAKKKLNMVVLDEVDAQVDKEGKFLYINELLPMMKEEFESVFVISHSQDTNQTAVFDERLKFSKPEDNHYTQIETLQ